MDTVITLRKPENYDPKEGARFEAHYEKDSRFYGEDAAPFEVHLREESGKFVWEVQDIEDLQMEKIIELRNEGLSQREIAEALGVSVGTINRRLKEAKENGLLSESEN